MKTIKVTTDNKISIADVDFDDFRDTQRAIGGHFETVHTQIMADYFTGPILMLVDEEGLMKGLPVNDLGCCLYGTYQHGNPIVGDIVFAVGQGEDITAPEDPDDLRDKLLKDFPFLREARQDEG